MARGGEYGGAATYVAEHVPDARRGFYTSFIQATATLGFFSSRAVIAGCRGSMSAESFGAWGWRLPFLLSFPLLAVSLYIRVKTRESPLFAKAKSAGQTSQSPLRAAFGNALHRRYDRRRPSWSSCSRPRFATPLCPFRTTWVPAGSAAS